MIDSDYNNEAASNIFLGEGLKKARLQKNMTISDVASHLRLRDDVISAVEQGEYPDSIHAYVKGYIRAYAKLLEMDHDWLNDHIKTLSLRTDIPASPMQLSPRGHWYQQLPMNTRMIASFVLLVLMCLIVARVFQSPIDEQAEIRDLVDINQAMNVAMDDNENAMMDDMDTMSEDKEGMDDATQE